MEGGIQKSLTEKIYNLKVDIVRELQDAKYQTDEYIKYREELVKDLLANVRILNDDSFRVRMHFKYIEKYRNKDAWNSLDTLAVSEIKEHIAPLVENLHDNELAKRFDHLMYTIDLAYLQNKNATKPIKKLIGDCRTFPKN